MSLYSWLGRKHPKTDLLHGVMKLLLKSRWESWPQIKDRDHKNLRSSNRRSFKKNATYRLKKNPN